MLVDPGVALAGPGRGRTLQLPSQQPMLTDLLVLTARIATLLILFLPTVTQVEALSLSPQALADLRTTVTRLVADDGRETCSGPIVSHRRWTSSHSLRREAASSPSCTFGGDELLASCSRRKHPSDRRGRDPVYSSTAGSEPTGSSPRACLTVRPLRNRRIAALIKATPELGRCRRGARIAALTFAVTGDDRSASYLSLSCRCRALRVRCAGQCAGREPVRPQLRFLTARGSALFVLVRRSESRPAGVVVTFDGQRAQLVRSRRRRLRRTAMRNACLRTGRGAGRRIAPE
jgi:hypothetical protein